MRQFMTFVCCLFAASPVCADTLESYLTRSGSHALITIELPFHVLHGLIDAEIEDTYSGRRANPIGQLRDDVMTWQATTGDIVIGEDDGALVVQTDARGIARLRGKLGFVPVGVSADIGLKAEVSMRPFLLPDWSIAANLEGRAIISEADLYGLSIRGELQPGLDRSVQRALDRMTQRMADPEYLRSKAHDAWLNLCQLPEETGKLTFVPSTAAASQPVFANNALRMSFVFSGNAGISDGLPKSCPDLPETLYLLE